jgi:hypothetical protein
MQSILYSGPTLIIIGAILMQYYVFNLMKIS